MTDLHLEREAMTAAPQPDVLARVLKATPLLILVGWLFVLGHFSSTWTTIGNVFNDTDDAMRLVEIRDLLAGQGWYDLHQYRFDPPSELPMHWSRLVDLPIAILVRLAEIFVSAATAEKVAMYLWPPMVLVAALFAVARIARRFGGDWVALPALYLTVTCPPVIGQFVPGRIDHHNVQITLTLWLVAFLCGAPSARRGFAAGLTTVAMMAVGMETMPYLVFGAAALALGWAFTSDRDEAFAYGATLSGGMTVAMAALMPPSAWFTGACDALSANFAALAIVGGGGLALGARWVPEGRPIRLAWLAAVGGVTLFAFALPEPACVRGPFAQINEEVRTVWLFGVTELQPWHVFFSAHHVDGLVALIVPALAGASALYLARDPETRRSAGFWVLVAIIATATAIGIGQIRTIIYADTLSVPLIAAAIGRAARRSEATGRPATVTVLVATVLASSSLATFVAERLGPTSWKADRAVFTATEGTSTAPKTATTGADAGAPCMTLSNYAALAALPKGVVSAEINIGPTILAATSHSVITAPYHRMQRGIVDGDRMLRRKPDEAIGIMEGRGVDYVVHCTASAAAIAARTIEPESMLVALMDGRVPDRLEPLVTEGVVRVWRLKRNASLADLRGGLTFH